MTVLALNPKEYHYKLNEVCLECLIGHTLTLSHSPVHYEEQNITHILTN